MLDERKAAILRAVVESHIRTAQPVSSSFVAQLGDLGVSPATVRNEMAVLEQDGYLFQPHASAGRVPTDKGYRFFVDSLSGPAPLAAAQSELVRLFFARTHGELERMLAETSGLLSRLTDYAAVVVAPSAPEPGRVREASSRAPGRPHSPQGGKPCEVQATVRAPSTISGTRTGCCSQLQSKASHRQTPSITLQSGLKMRLEKRAQR